VNNVNDVISFFFNVAISTFNDLVWLLGLLFVFGLMLYFISKFTRTTYINSVGEKMDIIFTGWIGTPVHELGHALFCILFRHRIIEMKLYNPNPANGTLGYVIHTYNPKSRYQKIGNFFIGIAPILFGTLVLYMLMFFLMPTLTLTFSNVDRNTIGLTQNLRSGSLFESWNIIYISTTGILSGIFSIQNLFNWKFWIFLYLS